MLPLIDTHCHLCAGLDDGPKTLDEAVEMCHLAWLEGTRWMAATAHQNEHWPDVTPQQILWSTDELTEKLRQLQVPMTLRPTGEVMVSHETLDQWSAGELLSVGDQRKYLLIEFPHGLYLDVRELAGQLVQQGVRPILAHPERHPELLHDSQRIDQLIRVGCLVQVVASSVVGPSSREDQRALKRWFRRGVVHLIGSDGHSPTRRLPLLREAYETIVGWTNTRVADRIFSTNGLAVLQGLPVKMMDPEPAKRSWFRIGG